MNGYGESQLRKTPSFGSSLTLREMGLAEQGARRNGRGSQGTFSEKTPLTGEPEVPPAINATLLTTILAVTIGSSFQFGYGTGVMNNSEEVIMGYFLDQGKEYTILQWGITVSMYGAGGLLGAVIGPKVIGRFVGRKTTLLINNVFVFLSSILIAYGQQWWVLALGRVFIGVVAGVATAVVPTYLSEISPIAIRGAVGTMHQLGITVGILVSQALSTGSLHLLGSKDKWQWLFLVPVVASSVQLLILPFMPESPSYLFREVGPTAARESLTRLQSPDVVDMYMDLIETELGMEQDSKQLTIGVVDLFRERSLRKQLVVGVVVQLMMQLSGIDAVFYYSTSVFYQAGVADAELATTLLGVINVIITVFAVRVMDSAGRKTLLTYSWMGMCTSFATLTLSFVFKPSVPYMDQVAVVAMTGIIIFFAFGPGCIAWFLIAEIFPLSARDTAMAVGITINWVANWAVAFTFPLLLEALQPWTFSIFAGLTGFFLFFTTKYVPETKGRTVAEVTQVFETMPSPQAICGPCCQ